MWPSTRKAAFTSPTALNDRIVWFDADGRFAAAISTVNGEKLARPVGIFIDSKDQLWIADTGNHRILGVKPTGAPEIVTPPPTEKGTPCDPTDLVVTADGRRMYVIDNNAHRLLIRDNKTQTWTALGGFGRSLGQFQWPFMLCIGEDRYIYISEAIGARVQRISPSDKWAGEIGRWGVNLGEFYRPKGLAADAKGRLYAGDSTMGVIQVFSAKGRVEGVLTGKDGTPLHFDHPMGMCFDRNGKLYVVELKAHRVAVVEMSQIVHEWTRMNTKK